MFVTCSGQGHVKAARSSPAFTDERTAVMAGDYNEVRAAAAHGVSVEDWRRIAARIEEKRAEAAELQSAMRAPERFAA